MRPAQRTAAILGGRHPCLWLLALALVLPCGCMSYDTALQEFDSVTRPAEGIGQPEDLNYRTQARRKPWLVRPFDGTVIDVLLESLNLGQPQEQTLENPSGFARERLAVLPGKADNLHRIAEVATRALWVANQDRNPLNQITALRGLALLLQRLEGDPVAMVGWTDESRAHEAELQAALEANWPGHRPGRLADPGERAEYLAALERITERPLFTPRDQRSLIRALDVAWAMETDPELAPAAEAALRGALFHGICMQLRRSLEADSPDVREAAIAAIAATGGPRAVPFLLFLIAEPPSVASQGRNRYDEDPMVRLALVRYCAQLDPRGVTTPYATGPEPIEFLYDVVREDPPQGGLRIAALEAMAHTLREPVVLERGWADAWWQAYVQKRSTN